MHRFSRRRFLGLGLIALPVAAALDAWLIEPTWLRVTRLELNPPGCRLVHFSDFHYKVDTAYAARVIRTINELRQEFVCFTGDLVEDRRYADEALSFIRQIKRPVFGCPGNHDYSSHANFADYEKAFGATGGAWLVDRSVVLESHNIEIVGMGLAGVHILAEPKAERRILLIHYPMLADRLGGGASISSSQDTH